METTVPIHHATIRPADEHRVVHKVQVTLKLIFGALAVIAGIDKFSNLITSWEQYLNPMFLNLVPLNAASFMHIVGVIEIAAGILVFAKPRLGGFVVMAWLIAIALQLIVWGRYLDIAVRDLVMALGGAWTLARLTPFAAASLDSSSSRRSV
jgi:hypothetical protein